MWRLNDYHTEPVTPIGIMVLSVVVAVTVSVGATFGGSLVYEYGFNVETAGDHPVWHKSRPARNAQRVTIKPIAQRPAG